MIVALEHAPKLRDLSIRPDEKAFAEALMGMGVSESVVNQFVLMVVFLDMIPRGGFAGRRGHFSRIDLAERLFADRTRMNETIAHELKHLALDILRQPDSGDLEFACGFYRVRRLRKYRWEELDCQRAEKKWGRLNYLYSRDWL